MSKRVSAVRRGAEGKLNFCSLLMSAVQSAADKAGRCRQ